MHEQFDIGQSLLCAHPRNNFRLHTNNSPAVLIENSMEYPEAVQKANGFLRLCTSRAAREWSLRVGMMIPARVDIRQRVEFTDGREQVKAEENVELVQCQRLREEPSAEVFRLEFPRDRLPQPSSGDS